MYAIDNIYNISFIRDIVTEILDKKILTINLHKIYYTKPTIIDEYINILISLYEDDDININIINIFYNIAQNIDKNNIILLLIRVFIDNKNIINSIIDINEGNDYDNQSIQEIKNSKEYALVEKQLHNILQKDSINCLTILMITCFYKFFHKEKYIYYAKHLYNLYSSNIVANYIIAKMYLEYEYNKSFTYIKFIEYHKKENIFYSDFYSELLDNLYSISKKDYTIIKYNLIYMNNRYYNINNFITNTCAVCLDSMDYIDIDTDTDNQLSQLSYLVCGHYFHHNCLPKNITLCPLCRTEKICICEKCFK